ncbi:DNA polymerase epsilon catalytic subunit A-like protein [Drosera capensis]
MQKVFALLLAEFRKLGATIVFANFSKVIIDTGKSDLSAAEAYCDSLLKAIQSRDLFEWIEIEPLNFWHCLLFMDQYNYGGIQAIARSGSPTEVSHSTSSGSNDRPQMDIVSSWNIVDRLPKETQDHFVLIVSEFMYIPWNYAQEQAAVRVDNEHGISCTPSITAVAAQKLELRLTEYLQDQISSYFSGRLFRIIQNITHHSKGMKKPESDARLSHVNTHVDGDVHTGDIALEFIKHVCAALALDQTVQHDVLVMRRNLLKYLQVPEFAKEAEFCAPCSSFTLPNVICSYCNDCRDLDLGRDPSLNTQEWRCAVPQCGQPYDREMMENSLLQIVRQRERMYHLQDLVCVKCRMVKDSHLAEQCACGGFFKCKEDTSEFRRKMRIFYDVAVQQDFQLLKESVSWILEIR